MKVKELIELLSDEDGALEVVLADFDRPVHNVCSYPDKGIVHVV